MNTADQHGESKYAAAPQMMQTLLRAPLVPTALFQHCDSGCTKAATVSCAAV